MWVYVITIITEDKSSQHDMVLMSCLGSSKIFCFFAIDFWSDIYN
jgi:hypothetical protein